MISRRLFLHGTAATLALAPASAFAQAKDPAKLRVALLPDENAATLIQQAQPLKAHLEKALGKQIELVVTTDYSSMIEAMRFGRIEVAYFGPFSYVLAKSVARAVQNGQVPAGALSKAIYEALLARKSIDGDKLKVIAITDPIPNYPMTMQGDLSPALKDNIRKAFIDLKDPVILKSFRVEGFAPTDDKAYDILRETAKILDLDLGKMS